MKYAITIACLLGSAAVAVPTFAQEDARSRSMELNESGFAAFEDGRFQEAAELFARAYDLVPDPALRKNEAVAWFKAKRCDEAIAAGNKLLLNEEAVPADRAEVQTIIANCKVEFARDALQTGSVDVAREFLAEAEALPTDAHIADQIKVVRLEIAALERDDEQQEDAADTTADTNDEGDSAPPKTAEPITADPAPAWQWALLGGGGAILVGGLVLHAVALGWQRQFLDMTETGGDPARFESLRNRVHTARVAVPLLYGVGAVGTAAGATLLFLLPAEQDPMAGRPTIGVRYVTHF